MAIAKCWRCLKLSPVSMQFVILAMGNTNAALPTNTNANNVELTGMEILGLKQISWNQLNGIKSIGKENGKWNISLFLWMW